MEYKVHLFTVKEVDIAEFNNEVVHQVCSTFSLAREIEFATRQHIFEYLNKGEEGIGSMIQVKHLAPALVGEQVEIQSEVVSFKNSELICRFTAKVNSRIIATGETGQKVVSKKKLKKIFSTLSDGK